MYSNRFPFNNGETLVRVFEQNDIIDAGLNAFLDPSESPIQDLHYWNTAYGHKNVRSPPTKNDLAQRALSDWLMSKGVKPNTLVILESVGFQASWDD